MPLRYLDHRESLNEASDARIYQHVQDGDAIAFITAFRGLRRTDKLEPNFIKSVLGNKYSGGHWFDEKDNYKFHLPDGFNTDGHYKEIKQKLREKNRRRNKKLREWGAKFDTVSLLSA